MKVLIYKLKKFILGLVIYVLLGISFILIYLIKFKTLMNYISNTKEAQNKNITNRNKGHILEIRRGIDRVSKYAFWRCKCFEHALTAHVLLRFFKISHTIYFGVAKDELGKLLAHAWCMSGDIIITGYSTKHKFTAVQNFVYNNKNWS